MSPQLEARRMSLIVRLTATQVYLRRAADEIGSDREGWPQTFVDAHVRFVDVFSDYRHFMHFTGADDIAYAEASFTEWHTVQAAYAGLSDVVRDRAATLPHPRSGELGRMRRCSAALRRALGADAALGGALLPFVDAVDAGLARLAGPSSSPAP
ncbi:MAG: hypothetical protein U1F43_30165 [Myxococcota bacterium]